MSDQETKPHSAEFFGESRDFWWNADFLELMGRRLQLDRAKTVLDVGCGVGHWGRVLAPVFSKSAQVTGIDREEAWVATATEKAKALGLGDRYRYVRGDVGALPFDDDKFDLVTCQTVLIHLKDPKAGLKEMLRVLKPGGMILTAEPNNLSNRLMLTSLSENESIDRLMARIKFGLMVERGKKALGLGFNSLGDLVPGYLAELDVENIRVYLSDKTVPYFPPYSTQEQRVNIQQIKDWSARKFIGWEREEALRYFIAGGGKKEEFQTLYDGLLLDGNEALSAIERNEFHTAGGVVTFLISGTKSLG